MDHLFRKFSSNFVKRCYFATKFLGYKNNEVQTKKYFKRTATFAFIGSTLIGLALSCARNTSSIIPGMYQSGLHNYTTEEVGKHKAKKNRVYVIYKEGFYDVTNYLQEHPGSEDIFTNSTGVTLEPWSIYTVRDDVKEICNIMESFRIGNLNVKTDEPCSEKQIKSEYFNDPERNALIKPINTQPFIGGPKATYLTEKYLTPNELCFIHNHLAVPNVDLNSYTLTVDIEGKDLVSFTLDELKTMPSTTVTATLQCASNRSLEMAKEFKSFVQGEAWEHNAIFNAEWKGVLLLDVLKAVGYDADCECNPYVQFESTDCPQGTFSTSIPLWRTVNEKCEVILAYEMNGEPLSRDHGFPLRVVIPGVTGTRWVKSLEKIRLQSDECDSKWHKFHYKMLEPSIKGPHLRESVLESAPALQEMPVNSAICKPCDRENVKVKSGKIKVEGYAWSGGGQKIARVEVSIDKGKNWIPATISNDEPFLPPYHWSWALWAVSIPIEKGRKCVDIWAKATDYSCNTQPEKWQWNFGGVGCNTIHKVRVFLE